MRRPPDVLRRPFHPGSPDAEGVIGPRAAGDDTKVFLARRPCPELGSKQPLIRLHRHPHAPALFGPPFSPPPPRGGPPPPRGRGGLLPREPPRLLSRASRGRSP